MTMTSTSLVFAAASLLAGCLSAPESREDPEGEIGSAPSELLNANALNMNALNMNALSSISRSAIQASSADGANSRELLRYTVSCALDATQSLSFSWTDAEGVAHDETYWGLMGLATTWETTPLSSSGEAWVSACLISRVNWYGAQVLLSSRGNIAGLNVIDPVERNAYTWEEGAFWGNLYGASPYAYSCSDTSNDSHSRSLLRDCAAGHLDAQGQPTDCGNIHRVGSCASSCDLLTPSGDYYKRCQNGSGNAAQQAKAVITVFLP